MEVKKTLDSYSNFIKSEPSDGSGLKRIVCEWTEIKPSKKTYKHIYTAGLNSKNGVFDDGRKRLVFTKLVLSTIFRPLHGVVKTLYHLSMIPIAKAIFFGLRGELKAKAVFIKSAQSIVDIARTPLYEMALLIIGTIGIISTLCHPTSVYKFREIIGKIETALFRQKFHCFTLARCFESIKLEELSNSYALSSNKKYLTNFNDTDYGDFSAEKLLEKGIVFKTSLRTGISYEINQNMTDEQKSEFDNTLIARSCIHLGRSRIICQRKNYNPFFQFFGKLSPNKAYISPAYTDKAS